MKFSRIGLAYVRDGAGAPVVFVHGSCGDWRTFDALRAAVSARFEYIAYSRRGHHPNAEIAEPADYAQESHLSDLAAFIGDLGVAPVHVVGNSQGGLLALRLTMERPELVRSVVVGEPGISALIETDPGAREVLEARARASAEVDQAIQAGDPQRAAILLFDQVCGEEGAFHKVSEERKRRWLDNAKTIGLRRAQEAVRSFRHEELGRIIRPILVVRGERTTPFHALATKAVLSSLPAGTIETVIPDAGHLSYADQPGAFGDAVMFFLARCAVMRRLPSSST